MAETCSAIEKEVHKALVQDIRIGEAASKQIEDELMMLRSQDDLPLDKRIKLLGDLANVYARIVSSKVNIFRHYEINEDHDDDIEDPYDIYLESIAKADQK